MPENSADLMQLQLTSTADGLQVRAVLETLTDPSRPQLVVGFDADSDAATGVGAPPASWQPKAPLGLDRAPAIDSSNARLLEAGPNPAVSTGTSGFGPDGQHAEGKAHRERSHGDLSGLQSVTIDTSGARLDPSTVMSLVLAGDGPPP
jgi:hypothetical protein